MMTFEEKVTQARKVVRASMELLNRTLAECPHDKLVAQTKYYPGGYDYTGHQDTWDECQICGKILNRTTNSTGRYG